MAGTLRFATASMVLATVSTMAGGVGEARLAALPLTVTVHNYAVLPPAVLERAQHVATKIYGRIGVSLTWVAGWPIAADGPTTTAACPDSPTPRIHLRLLDRSANRHRATGDLGFAVSGGTLASVLVERVEYVAKRKSLDVGDLLGVIIAHELGHLLLPPESHSTGIMAPRIDLVLIDRGGPSFDQRQAWMIRARIASMSRGWHGPCRADVRQRLHAPAAVTLLGTRSRRQSSDGYFRILHSRSQGSARAKVVGATGGLALWSSRLRGMRVRLAQTIEGAARRLRLPNAVACRRTSEMTRATSS